MFADLRPFEDRLAMGAFKVAFFRGRGFGDNGAAEGTMVHSNGNAAETGRTYPGGYGRAAIDANAAVG